MITWKVRAARSNTTNSPCYTLSFLTTLKPVLPALYNLGRSQPNTVCEVWPLSRSGLLTEELNVQSQSSDALAETLIPLLLERSFNQFRPCRLLFSRFVTSCVVVFLKGWECFTRISPRSIFRTISYFNVFLSLTLIQLLKHVQIVESCPCWVEI